MDPVSNLQQALHTEGGTVTVRAVLAAADLEAQRAALFISLARTLIELEGVEGEQAPKKIWTEGAGLQVIDPGLVRALRAEFTTRAVQAFRSRDALLGREVAGEQNCR